MKKNVMHKEVSNILWFFSHDDTLVYESEDVDEEVTFKKPAPPPARRRSKGSLNITVVNK